MGVEGETISPPKNVGRHLIHNLGKAVYASPENLEKFAANVVSFCCFCLFPSSITASETKLSATMKFLLLHFSLRVP